MKNFQKISKRLLPIYENIPLKKYKLILNLFASLLVIYLIFSISGCIDISGPGSGSYSTKCGNGASKDMHFYPLNGQYQPHKSWLAGSHRKFSYKMRTSDICLYKKFTAYVLVYVDTSAVTEGLTISGMVDNTLYEFDFNTSLKHNFNNTGQSQFSGNISMDSYGPFDKGTSDIHAIVKFPTKGSEQQDLNYLYSKIIDVYIKILYYKYNPDYKP